MKNISSNRQIRGVVRAVLGGVSTAAVCTPLFAQTAPPASTPQPTDDQLQEVVVTGIRASLQRSMDIKENAIGVVDAISAEDIGQFPDANIGDAICAYPGRDGESRQPQLFELRRRTDCDRRTQGITVRGFGGTVQRSADRGPADRFG